MTLARKTVLVLFGGRSSEHAISCISAGNVLRALDRQRFDVVPVGITRTGQWIRQPDDADRLTIDAGVLPEVWPEGPLVQPPSWPGGDFLSFAEGRWTPLPTVDVVFPVLHGPFGEDGTIQGLLEMAGVPYVGSGVFASAAAMDKGHTKALLAAAGMSVGRWAAWHRRDWLLRPDDVRASAVALGFPVFVKPCRAGSSVGVSKVSDLGGLDAALDLAAEQDARLIIEASVEQARELECGVLAQPDGTLAVSSFGEIKVRSGHEFYDFAAKYLDDSVDLIVPADLAPETQQRLTETALRAFTALGCEGLARVDFFLGRDDRPVINEVNTMPGFTAISMYPRMWQASGVAYPELVTALIDDALARGTGLR